MHDGTLHHTLKSKRGLRINFLIAICNRNVLHNESFELTTQIIDISVARFEHVDHQRIIEQGEQQML